MKSMLPLVFALALLAGCTNPEEQAFKRARVADTVVGWEDFLRHFPDGAETDAARKRLVELHEDREWQRAELADSVDSYQEYLRGYPQGRFSGEALVRIANLNLREIPDHEPTPEELRAAHLAQLAGKPVGVGESPEGGAVAPATPPAQTPELAAATPPAQTPELAAPRGPTALIHRGPPQIVRLVPVKEKPAPKPVPVAKLTPAKAPAPTPIAAPAPAPIAATATATAGQGWAVQLGAFGKGEAAALQHWQRLQRLVPAAVRGLSPNVAAPAEGKAFHRLRVVGLSRERAREVCVAVRGAGEGCVVTAP